MKTIKTFKQFTKMNEDINLDYVERQVIADAVRNGDLVASAEYSENLTRGFEVKLFDYGGAVDSDKIGSDVLDKIATRIENGDNFGVVERPGEEMNIEFVLELD